MLSSGVPGLDQFLGEHLEMAVVPSPDAGILISGTFRFRAHPPKHPEIEDQFDLSIRVPEGFPGAVPLVSEEGKRLFPYEAFHVNPNGTFCLGSPLRMLIMLQQEPTFTGFIATILVPYLYAMSHKLRYGGEFVFKDLDHGSPGLLADYREILQIDSVNQVLPTLKALGLRKRLANKQPCPCGCGKRLGVCRFNDKVRRLRAVGISRQEYRREFAGISGSVSSHLLHPEDRQVNLHIARSPH